MPALPALCSYPRMTLQSPKLESSGDPDLELLTRVPPWRPSSRSLSPQALSCVPATRLLLASSGLPASRLGTHTHPPQSYQIYLLFFSLYLIKVPHTHYFFNSAKNR